MQDLIRNFIFKYQLKTKLCKLLMRDKLNVLKSIGMEKGNIIEKCSRFCDISAYDI